MRAIFAVKAGVGGIVYTGHVDHHKMGGECPSKKWGNLVKSFNFIARACAVVLCVYVAHQLLPNCPFLTACSACMYAMLLLLLHVRGCAVRAALCCVCCARALIRVLPVFFFFFFLIMEPTNSGPEYEYV